jgi:hypothetical protein
MAKTNKWWADELNIRTKAGVEQKIREIVALHADGQPLKPMHAEVVDVVLRHHYQHSAKTGPNFSHYEVRTNAADGFYKPTRGFWAVRQDGSAIDVSWRVALMPGGRPSPKDDASAAARHEIAPQITAFHAGGKCEDCALCGQFMMRGIGLHVDHVTLFNTLFADWLGRQGLDYAGIQVADCGLYGEFADRALAQSWHAYHAQMAELRLVHALCNLERGRS